MKATSIARTGALPGDKVRCVGILPSQSTARVERFTVGNIYTVIDHAGTPSARGQTDYKVSKKKILGDPGWSIPWSGFGWEWEKVE